MSDAPDYSLGGSDSLGGGNWLSTSSSLLEGLRLRDESAWNRMVTLYGGIILRWCLRKGISRHDLSDVSQDVFSSIARSIPSFRHDRPGDTFLGWLHEIVRKRIADHWRHKAEEEPAVGGSTAQQRVANVPCQLDDSSDIPLSDRTLAARKALAAIRMEFSGKHLRAFELTVIDGLSPAEAADELKRTGFEMTPNAVSQAKSRMLRRVRVLLGDLPD